MESESENEDYTAGQEYADGMLHESSKGGYEGKMKQVLWWCKNKYPALVLVNDVIDIQSMTGIHIAEFIGFISKKREWNKRDSEFGPLFEPLKYNSFEHVSGFRSALKWYCTSTNQNMETQAHRKLIQVLAGYKRKVANLKQNGDMPLGEGKSAMNFSAYKYLAKFAMNAASNFKMAIYAHLFLLLCWNLIARNVSVWELLYDHVWWEDDCMVMIFVTTKNDKEAKHSPPKHVYANPENPEICPILSLGIYIFTTGFRREGSKRTVFGTESKGLFGDWLKRVLQVCATDLLILGMKVIDVGTHSFRKGVSGFLSGIIDGPNPIAIYLRAGWSLGRVQSRYILECTGGDRLCGRAASGLCLTSPEFTCLPPHFDMSRGDPLSVEEWEEIVPGYAKFYPDSFRQVLPYLLASIVYHRKWLVENLHANHPLFQTSVWRDGIPERLAGDVLCGYGRNTQSGMMATGIPSTVLLAQEFRDFKGEFVAFKDDLYDRINTLPTQIKECILENFQVNGAVQLTVSQVETMLGPIRDALLENNRLAREQHNQSTVAEANHSNNGNWTWNGQLHPVPKDFRFPKTNLRCMWENWWEGNASKNYQPLKQLKCFDLAAKSDRQLLSKARYVMKTLISFATNPEHRSFNAVTRMSRADQHALFNQCFESVIRTRYPASGDEIFDKWSVGQISYLTMYDVMKSMNLEA